MKLYEINQEINDLNEILNVYAEEHDGELPEHLEEQLTNLEIEREQKLVNLGRWHKAICAEAKAVKDEKLNLAYRQKVLENKAEAIKLWMSNELNQGEKIKDATVQLSWRKSKSVDIIDETLISSDYIESVPKLLKSKIKEDLLLGKDVSGAKISENNNLQIK